MPVEDGSILPNAKDGIVTMAMIDLIATTPPKLYLVKGLELDEGAIASTATNRSGMMMVVGTDDESMAKVTNAVISGGGGIGIVNNDRMSVMHLDFLGQMSSHPAAAVLEEWKDVRSMFQNIGIDPSTMLNTLSDLALTAKQASSIKGVKKEIWI